MTGFWKDLRALAETFEDAQKYRLAQQGRLREGTLDERATLSLLVPLEEHEAAAKKLLLNQYKGVAEPIRTWQEASPGIGAHLMARLLGAIGDPYIAQPYHWEGEGASHRVLVADEPFERTVSQLWQYCGHGAPVRRSKGMSAEQVAAAGNPRGKFLTFLLASAAVKAGVRSTDGGDRYSISDYGHVYLAEKKHYAERTHSGPCSGGFVSAGPGKVVFARCKVDDYGNVVDSKFKGRKRYAEAGDPFSPGHINAIALRYLGKRILADLWAAAKESHG